MYLVLWRAIMLAKRFGIKGRVLVFVKQTNKKLDRGYRLNLASKNPYVEILSPVPENVTI